MYGPIESYCLLMATVIPIKSDPTVIRTWEYWLRPPAAKCSASYDYDPFGQTLKTVGDYSDSNPFDSAVNMPTTRPDSSISDFGDSLT